MLKTARMTAIRNFYVPKHHFATAGVTPAVRNHRLYSSSLKEQQGSASEFSSSSSNQCSSSRGRAAVGLLPSYLADARSVTTYSPESPQGALQLGVAESKMLEDWLVPVLNDPTELSADAIYYQPTSGRADLKEALNSYIQYLCDTPPLRTDNLIVGAGCNAVLENLCFCLADAGDTVLIPTPYYAAFEFDLVARANLQVAPVETASFHPEATSNDAREAYYPNVAALDAAYERCQDKTSRPPKILLISHPMNPLGICYPAETVLECIDWCREKRVHLISDEIYAGSVYGESFDSVLKLTKGNLGNFVHWVYALSKDFALSGLRVGAAYTENSEILLPLQKLNDLCQVSSQTQLWTAQMLQKQTDINESWVKMFRKENHLRLQSRADATTAVLDRYQVPYLKPTAGLFVWIDLSKFVEDTESELYLRLIESGILLTPGQSMRHTEPGFFRCVFTAANEAEFDLALQRLASFFASQSF